MVGSALEIDSRRMLSAMVVYRTRLPHVSSHKVATPVDHVAYYSYNSF